MGSDERSKGCRITSQHVRMDCHMVTCFPRQAHHSRNVAMATSCVVRRLRRQAPDENERTNKACDGSYNRTEVQLTFETTMGSLAHLLANTAGASARLLMFGCTRVRMGHCSSQSVSLVGLKLCSWIGSLRCRAFVSRYVCKP